jgi:hypothetical protein
MWGGKHLHILPCLLPTDITPLCCRYDGYRLTYLGYDFLAIKTLVNRGSIAGVGRQVGVAPTLLRSSCLQHPQQQCLWQSARWLLGMHSPFRRTWLHSCALLCPVLRCGALCRLVWGRRATSSR